MTHAPPPSPPAGTQDATPPQPPPPGAGGARGTNGFAIASLVLGVLGGPFLSVVFAIVALVQIRRRGQRGKGYAVAGLVLSGIWTVVAVVAVVAWLGSEAERDRATGNVVGAGSVTLDELRPGDCMNGIEESSLQLSADVVPCDQPHEGEVFATFDLTTAELPPPEALVEMAETECADHLNGYASEEAAASLELFYFHPTEGSWSEGDRRIICVATHPDRRTGSIRG